MNIPKEYKDLLEPGDLPKLMKLTGKARSTIYKMLDDGECQSASIAIKVNSFFKARKAEIKKAEQIDQD